MNLEKIIDYIYARPVVRLALHAGFWATLVLINLYITGISFNAIKDFPYSRMLALTVMSTFRLMIIFYPLVYWILPRFFYRKRLLGGILLAVGLLMFHGFTDVLTEEFILKKCPSCLKSLSGGNGYVAFLKRQMSSRWLSKVFSAGTFFFTIFNLGFPLSIKLGLQVLRSQFRSARLQRENLQLEFNFLRAQVNPHFLFNTLNNIYGLILKEEKENSAAMVARLSQFLRYALYESNSEKVALEKEVQVLKDYVDLESVRMNHTKVQFDLINDGSVQSLPPLLFMPLVENAFKYTADVPDAVIRIGLVMAKKEIYCIIQNTIDAQKLLGKGGIGLTNFRKRLNLYYPGKYDYEVKSNENLYTASIKIASHE